MVVEIALDVVESGLNEVSADVDETVERSVVDEIIASFAALGYDVETSYERIVSILNVLVTTGEWDSDHALALMEALADGIVSEAEIDAVLLGVVVASDTSETLEDVTQVMVSAIEDITTTVSETLETYSGATLAAYATLIQVLQKEIGGLEAQILELENRPGFGLMAPLVPILALVIDGVSERLDSWLANAFGIEE